MFDRILVPLDGSKIAEQVLLPVAEVARAFGSEVIVVEVCAPEEDESFRNMCGAYLDSQVADLQRQIGLEAGPPIHREVLVGKPAESLLRLAKKIGIQLIAMASHGRSGIKPWSLGSTVDKVLRNAHVPILIVRASEKPHPGEPSVFQRILVPLDGSERGEAALPYIDQMMQRMKPETLLLSVVAPGKHVHTIGGLNYVRFEDHTLESLKTHAWEYLRKARERLGERNQEKVLADVRVGEPAQEIVRFAEEKGCTLIALSTHGHSGIEKWFLGSTTQKVLHLSKQSLWIVPAF